MLTYDQYKSGKYKSTDDVNRLPDKGLSYFGVYAGAIVLIITAFFVTPIKLGGDIRIYGHPEIYSLAMPYVTYLSVDIMATLYWLPCLLGAIGLLLRKQWAYYLSIICFFSVAATLFVYAFEIIELNLFNSDKYIYRMSGNAFTSPWNKTSFIITPLFLSYLFLGIVFYKSKSLKYHFKITTLKEAIFSKSNKGKKVFILGIVFFIFCELFIYHNMIVLSDIITRGPKSFFQLERKKDFILFQNFMKKVNIQDHQL